MDKTASDGREPRGMEHEYVMRRKKLRPDRRVTLPNNARNIEWQKLDDEVYLCWLEPQ